MDKHGCLRENLWPLDKRKEVIDMDILEQGIDNALEVYTLEQLFEECGITPEEVVEYLLKNGMIVLPEVFEIKLEEQE